MITGVGSVALVYAVSAVKPYGPRRRGLAALHMAFDRIFTTHAGRLPRPERVVDQAFAAERILRFADIAGTDCGLGTTNRLS